MGKFKNPLPILLVTIFGIGNGIYTFGPILQQHEGERGKPLQQDLDASNTVVSEKSQIATPRPGPTDEELLQKSPWISLKNWLSGSKNNDKDP
ncbi:hypothetical protein M501DRAFT_1000052 [Patellaria atrata CBS 101060]|uniref:Uncharacterized protein n=1 Tax=Patellaria atrata CBS 101060 TaxID=1346257 RepID=A0A9P4S3X8_9PEZI|nr:hypothetical protein M501DRAFT_1000052 [Patellaria atrata CBS 101060]